LNPELGQPRGHEANALFVVGPGQNLPPRLASASHRRQVALVAGIERQGVEDRLAPKTGEPS